jgi:transposase
VAAPDVMAVRLHLPATRVLEVLEDLPERLVVAVVAVAGWVRCWACGYKTRAVHQTTKVRVRDLPVGGRPTTLVWHRRRFRCRRCGTTTTESHPHIRGHLTNRLRAALVAEVRDSTVAAAARRHGLGWHQVMAVVADYATALFFSRRRMRCRVLMVDEKSLVKGHGGFSTIVSDGETGAVVAVLPGRSEAVLGRFLARQTRSWRAGVQVVVTDMAACYRGAIAAHLPRASHIVDRFHVVRAVMGVLTEARREAQRTERGAPHDPAVFRARFTLLRRIDRLSPAQVAELAALFGRYPHLRAAWEMVQRFHRIYEADGYEAASEAVGEFCAAWERTRTDMGSAVRTLCRWSREVFNFHTNERWTSAVAEGVNNKIEVLERKAYGFRRAVNHQARILLECAGHRRRNRAA